jgi:signal transduction histidine kinase
MEQYQRAEKLLYYVEQDLARVARDRALDAAKKVGMERLLDGRADEIEAALEQAGYAPGTFESLRLEGFSRLAPAGAPPPPPGDLRAELRALEDGPPATEGESEESLPILGTDSRTTGVLRFRYACAYVHGTLIREYFQRDFANPDLVVRVTEPDGRVIHETSPTPSDREWEVKRVMTTPSMAGLRLYLRYKEGSIRQEVRRLTLTKIALIAFIDLMLLAGLVLVFSNVRRELQLSRLKSDFVANVSHELKTPLALIRLFSETLELGRVPNEERRRQYYRVINKESQRLTQLINNILDFSRIEAGRREYKFSRTDVARVLDEVLEAYRFQIEQQGFELEVQVEEGLPEAQVDAEALGQAVINLLNNSLKYSREDKRISVTLRRDDGRLRLSVRDHGIGVAKGEQQKIFEKFYRAEDSLVHETKGSGLGLSLVRHIMEAHGGSVELESAPGSGSTFTLVLPLEGAREQGAALHAPVEGRP